MALDLSILYRGPLASCNYECHYCPFAKRQDSREQLADDRRRLERFVDWAASRQNDRIGLLFTPWGEALIRSWYQAAFVRLSHAANVRKVAIQTNLSCRLNWLEQCDLDRVALWCTYHPSQIKRARFLNQCRQLDRIGVRYSVGMVGLREDLEEIEATRRALRQGVYLWVNAYKRDNPYYTSDELQRLSAVDPLFPVNNQRHPSMGRRCRTGSTVISIDGDGNVARCHFIKRSLGNIYATDIEDLLRDEPCTNETCGCHIGYVHMDELRLYEVFGEGVLERIPAQPVWSMTSGPVAETHALPARGVVAGDSGLNNRVVVVGVIETGRPRDRLTAGRRCGWNANQVLPARRRAGH